MKVLVTGSEGLLGNALKRYLGDNHFYHSRKKVDLKDLLTVNEYIDDLANEGCDTVIHCAARVGGLQANMDNNSGFFHDNYHINNNVLSASYKHGIKNFVSILSTCIFPDKEINYPLTAEQINNGAPHPSNYGYSYAKRLLGYETNIFRKVTKNNWISVVPTNVYGTNDNFNLNDGHLIPALIHKAYLAKQTGSDFIVWGDGKPLRQFIFSDDLARAIMWAVENWDKDAPFMAINEKEYSIEEIALMIARIFDIDKNKIVFDTSKPSGQFRKPAKTDIPSNFKFTPIEEGLKTSIDWFVKNYDRVRK